MEKRKYTYKEMINYMKSKGIKFELMNEQQAIKYLRKENYYFKLTAYRKNFPKVNGKYVDLDFAYLTRSIWCCNVKYMKQGATFGR